MENARAQKEKPILYHGVEMEIERNPICECEGSYTTV